MVGFASRSSLCRCYRAPVQRFFFIHTIGAKPSPKHRNLSATATGLQLTQVKERRAFNDGWRNIAIALTDRVLSANACSRKVPVYLYDA